MGKRDHNIDTKNKPQKHPYKEHAQNRPKG